MGRSPVPDMNGEEKVRKHIVLSPTIYALFEKEANDTAGGNISLLLRKILRKRYNLKPNGGKE